MNPERRCAVDDKVELSEAKKMVDNFSISPKELFRAASHHRNAPISEAQTQAQQQQINLHQAIRSDQLAGVARNISTELPQFSDPPVHALFSFIIQSWCPAAIALSG